MKKQLKYRVWDIQKKVFIPVDKFGLITTDFGAFGIMLTDWEGYKEGEYFYNDYQTFSECTYLKDVKGNQIYEGDILRQWYSRDTTGKDIVVWNEAVEYDTDHESSGFKIEFIYSSEIIGNIYENPELLPTIK